MNGMSWLQTVFTTAVAAGSLLGAPPALAQAVEGFQPPSAREDTLALTLAEAHARALSDNPEYRATRQEIGIAAGRLEQSRVYRFNPELEFEAPGIGATGEIGEYEASLHQEIEWAGQRGLRIREAQLGYTMAEAAVLDAARRTLVQVSEAFYSAQALEQRLGVAREIFALNEELVAVTRIQAREGEISVMDANLAEIEAGRARAAVRSSERALATALMYLRRLLRLNPEQPLRLIDEVPDAPAPATLSLDSLTALALARRPDLSAGALEVERMETATRLARRVAIPNVRLGLILEREESYTPGSTAGSPIGLQPHLENPRLGLAVSIPIPLFQRNQGRVSAATAETQQALANREAAELAVRAEVVDALQAYRSASEEHRIFEDEVLQPARANQRLLETAFRAGKVALPTLLLLRNQLLEAELSHWEAWLAERRAVIDLAAATATFSTELIPAPEEVR